MTQKNALAMAAGITAFVLVLVGALVTYVTHINSSAAAGATTTGNTAIQAQDTSAVEQAPADPSQSIQAVIDAREAAYKQQLAEAKTRLEEANARLQQMYDLLKTVTPQAQQQAAPTQQPADPAQQPSQPSEPAYSISPRDAAIAALQLAPGASLVSVPDLVSFRGSVAYEVRLDTGTMYVDANSGQVLYNGAAAAPAPSGSAPASGNNEYEEGGDD